MLQPDRIAISPLSFIIAGISVLAIAWLTISYLSIKAVATNPSETLRME